MGPDLLQPMRGPVRAHSQECEEFVEGGSAEAGQVTGLIRQRRLLVPGRRGQAYSGGKGGGHRHHGAGKNSRNARQSA